MQVVLSLRMSYNSSLLHSFGQSKTLLLGLANRHLEGRSAIKSEEETSFVTQNLEVEEKD